MRADPAAGPLPDWIILHESPLGRYVAPSVSTLVRRQYELLEYVKGSGSVNAGNVFDLQDAFYVPYAGFRDVARPGPDIRIYRNRASATGGLNPSDSRDQGGSGLASEWFTR